MNEAEYYYDPQKNQMQQLLEELIDKGVIYEWYYNGEYHWSYTKTKETVSAWKDEPQPEVVLTKTEGKHRWFVRLFARHLVRYERVVQWIHIFR